MEPAKEFRGADLQRFGRIRDAHRAIRHCDAVSCFDFWGLCIKLRFQFDHLFGIRQQESAHGGGVVQDLDGVAVDGIDGAPLAFDEVLPRLFAFGVALDHRQLFRHVERQRVFDAALLTNTAVTHCFQGYIFLSTIYPAEIAPVFRHLHASGKFKTHVVVPFLKTVISNAFFYPIIKSGSVFEKCMQLTCIDRLDLCLADQVMVDRDKRVHAATLPSSTMASILFAQAARTSGKHTAGKICGARNTEMYSFGLVTNALEGSDSKRSSPSRYRASQRAFRKASSSCAFVTSDDATSYRPVFRIAGSTSSNTQTSKRLASGLWDFAMRR